MHEARFYTAGSETDEEGTVRCRLCPHNCRIAPRRRGLCGVRENRRGKLCALTYGQVTSLALDPVEKKPLYHFYPGQKILSLGSWGCNFKCLFCQNWEISQQQAEVRTLSPQEVATFAIEQGAVGLAYTYNEPYINFEYILDCCKDARRTGLKNVLVSNGYYNPAPLAELLPWVDAFNIDIKAFNADFYRQICGGELQPVLDSVKEIAQHSHLEVTLLLIPETNDEPRELEEMARWLLANCGVDVPLHISAYQPCYKFTVQPTSREDLARAREIFRRYLRNVYVGNLRSSDWQNSACASCGTVLVERNGYDVTVVGLGIDGCCRQCGAHNNFIAG